LVYDAFLVDDDTLDNSNGNGNGIADCGETIELYVDLLNQGLDPATSVDATISTSDPFVTFLFNTGSPYPDISGGGTGTNTSDYDLTLDAGAPHGRVITFNLDITASNGGPWTDAFTMTVTCIANNPPNEPSNPTPADEAVGVSATAVLTWTGGDPDAGDTVTYDVYFGASSNPTVTICSGVSSPTCDPGPLSSNTQYYWYVVATDNHGASTTGTTWWFVTELAPPVGPLVYDGAFLDDDTGGNSIGNDDGIANCGERIELFVDLLNQGVNAATSVASSISTNDSYVTWLFNTSSAYPDIAAGGTGRNRHDYDFALDALAPDEHVITFDLDITAANGGPWTDTFTVTVTCAPNGPPYTPTVPSPEDGALGVSATADLSWTGGDPEAGDTVTYDVYFDTISPTTTLLCDDAPSPFCDPGTLSYGTDYYWHVVATDSHGASTTGPIWAFSTASGPSVGPLVYDSFLLDDDNSGQSSGNEDGIADCGETIELFVDLLNQGPNPATSVDATISTSDPHVTWLFNTDSDYPSTPIATIATSPEARRGPIVATMTFIWPPVPRTGTSSPLTWTSLPPTEAPGPTPSP
jgi:hypothetical protein